MEQQPLYIKGNHPKIQNAIIRMKESIHALNSPYAYFAYFCDYINFYECTSESVINTAAVSFKNGQMVFYYYRHFIDKLNTNQIVFLILHECFHLLRTHIDRIKNANLDIRLSNVATDFVINYDISMMPKPSGVNIWHAPITDENGKDIALYLPKEYPADLPKAFEAVYWWVYKKSQDAKQSCNSQTDQSQEGNGTGSKRYGKYSANPNVDCYDFDYANATSGKTIDVHIDSEDISEEELKTAQGVINSVMDALKNRGIEPGNYVGALLDKLFKPKKNLLRPILNAINTIKGFGSKFSTYRVVNKNEYSNDGFVQKGKLKNNPQIILILDTSGSMGDDFVPLLSQLLAMKNLDVYIVQIDTQVTDAKLVKSVKELQNLLIKGGGGTILQPAIDFVVADNKLSGRNIVLMTDGYTDHLDFSAFKGSYICISTTDTFPHFVGKEPKAKYSLNE